MQKNKDNQNDFAIIHVRPGLEGKAQPVGTVAVNLSAARQGTLLIGYAIQHSRLDSWDAARGRVVAIGRASRARESCVTGSVNKNEKRRELLISALRCLAFQMTGGGPSALNVSRGFRRAVHDTLDRLVAAKRSADLKRTESAAE